MAHSKAGLLNDSRRCAWIAIALVAGVAAVVLPRTAVEAHQVITSKYNYSQHLFPVFRDRCGQCHVEGGPTPMSLVSYADAVPWAESIREQTVAESMPPWYADPDGPAVKGAYGLTAKELDMIVTWVSGGTPRSIEKVFFGVNAGAALGITSSDPAPFKPDLKRWKAGQPDLAIRMPADAMVPADMPEDTRDIVVPTGLKTDKWIRAVDLLPGTPSMVRDAVISIEKGAVLAAWQPGDELVSAPAGTGFHVPAGATLQLRIHYKKNWKEQHEAKSDRSTIGLYFMKPPAAGEIATLPLTAPDGAPDGQSPRSFQGMLKTTGKVVALRPSIDQPYARVSVEAVLLNGQHVELLRLRAARPGWDRRYWLTNPVSLPTGTTIAVIATPLPPTDGSAAPRSPLTIAVEYVAQHAEQQ